MTNSKQKGARFERELSNIFKEHGYTARRSQQYCGYNGASDDVLVDEIKDFIHIEAKHDERLNIHDAIDQTLRDCPEGKWRCVFHKKNGRGILVTMPLEDFMDVLKELMAFKKG